MTNPLKPAAPKGAAAPDAAALGATALGATAPRRKGARRSELLPGFLIEAWEGLVGLEDAWSGLERGSGEAARRSLVLLSHRLKGSAGLYGFPRLARLAGHVERFAEQLPAGAALP
ncbi:MAG: Hpt domain-containing protein, partial [Acidobacteriota bacterium]